jgi:hypothetical protein
MKGCTQHEIVIRHLEDAGGWVAAPVLQKLNTKWGYLGSAGDVRARELARNECPNRLKDRVEREEGRRLGLDPRFVYYRVKEAVQLTLV